MPTIQQIAELAGVSRGTVDRVLHNRPNVSPMVREKVMYTAKKLGFQPAHAAEQPKKRTAILVPPWTDKYFNRQISSGIHQAMRYIADSGFSLVECPLHSMTMQELLRVMQQQVEQGIDGLIIRAENTPEVSAAIESVAARGVQIVTYDADVPDSGRLCHVGQDLWRAGAIAAGVMARLVRPPEHVLVVTGNLRMEAHKGRVDGFCCRLEELGFPQDAYRVIETNEMPALTRELIERAFRQDDRLHAVYMATQPISACIAGLRKVRAANKRTIHVVCNDLTPTAKRYLQEGLVDFVIGQAFYQESFRATQAMYRILMQGVRPRREIYFTDLSLISKEML